MPDAKPPRRGGVVGYLTRRHDPLTSLVLTIPVFLVYHIGILLIDLRNGVDLISGLTFRLLEHSVTGYLLVTLGVAAGIAGAGWWLRRKGHLQPTRILPVLGESLALALLMTVTVGWATAKLLPAQLVDAQVGPHPLTGLERLVMAAGAGFHEEIVFRVGLFAGGALLLRRVMRPSVALIAAALASSLIFSAVHYVGELGNTFKLASFTFRAIAGLYLCLVYRLRGFAVAVYTHTLYDLLCFFVFPSP